MTFAFVARRGSLSSNAILPVSVVGAGCAVLVLRVILVQISTLSGDILKN